DAQVLVAADRDRRTHLDDRIEHHRAALAPFGDVDLGRSDHIDVVLDDRTRVVGGKRLTQRLFATDARAELRLEDAPGRLARPEARQTHLLRDALEGRVDLPLELCLVDLDGDLDLVVLEDFDRALHRSPSVSVRLRAAPPRRVTRRAPDPGSAAVGSAGPRV